MKVRATCNVKYDADWRKPGEVFEIRDDDWDAVKEYAEAVKAEKPAAKAEPEAEESAEPRPKSVRRSRK